MLDLVRTPFSHIFGSVAEGAQLTSTVIGNKPPWTLPAKRKYGVHDTRRSAERCGVPDIRVPPDFMARAMTVLVCLGTTQPSRPESQIISLNPVIAAAGTARCQD